jgi:hypothetical protein
MKDTWIERTKTMANNIRGNEKLQRQLFEAAEIAQFAENLWAEEAMKLPDDDDKTALRIDGFCGFDLAAYEDACEEDALREMGLDDAVDFGLDDVGNK